MGRRRWVVGIMCALAAQLALAQQLGDADKDGVGDDVDLCPDLAETQNSLSDEDGCPDGDQDSDSVADDSDLCPSDPETVNSFEDMDGCPDKAGAELHELAKQVFFDSDTTQPDQAGRTTIGEVARLLSAHPEIVKLRIEGRTDARGAVDKNLALAQLRATTVRDLLVAAGVAPDRLEASGKGALPGKGKLIEKQNRRAEFVVTEIKQGSADALKDRFQPLDDFAGEWKSAAAAAASAGLPIDLHVGYTPDDVYLTVLRGAPAWLGPEQSRVYCYSMTKREQVIILHCQGLELEVSLSARQVDGKGVGWVQGKTKGDDTQHAVQWSSGYTKIPPPPGYQPKEPPTPEPVVVPEPEPVLPEPPAPVVAPPAPVAAVPAEPPVAPARSKPIYRRWQFWTICAGALESGLGLGLMLHASGVADDAAKERDEARVIDMTSSAQSTQKLGAAMVIVGVVNVAVGALFWPKKPRRTEARGTGAGNLVVAPSWIGVRGDF